MKSSTDIQGLPIFSLIDGAEIGRIKQLAIRPEAGRIDLFVVENELDSIGVQVLPYASAIGVGDFAVTIESADSIRDLHEVDGARDLILKNYKVIGTRVLSRKGQLLGAVNEYYVDPDTGDITACSFSVNENADVIRVFHRSNIMTFGRDVIVIKEEALIRDSLDEDAALANDTVIPLPNAAHTEAAAAMEPTDAPQQHYLSGKVLSADLTDEAGQVLAAQGTVLDDELIERIKAAGPTLFMKLNRLAVEQN